MPLSEDDCDVIYKVLIVGDSGVGKTAILDCLMGREFNEHARPTVGVDFVRKVVEADGAIVQLRIWDTAGMEKFRSLTKLQYRGVQGLIIVYDVTNEASFQSVQYWLSNIHHMIRSPERHPYEPVPFLVVGNKCDATSERKVSFHRGSKFATQEMAFGFYEISAKTGKNVYKAFHRLAYHITDITHPKLMKSYHPNFLRPPGVKPEVSAAELHRLSTPSFSPSPPPALIATASDSGLHRYSLWDPHMPWLTYNAPRSPQPAPRKSRVKRLKMKLPFLKKNKKRKADLKRKNEALKMDTLGHPDASGSRTNKARRHYKKRIRRFFHLRKRGKRNKKNTQKTHVYKKRKIKFSKYKKVKRRFKRKSRKSGVEQEKGQTSRQPLNLGKRIRHLFPCFHKQKDQTSTEQQMTLWTRIRKLFPCFHKQKIE